MGVLTGATKGKQFVAIRKYLAAIIIIGILVTILVGTVAEAKAEPVLKLGSRGTAVSQVQQDLKGLGYFNYHQATGYFGTITQDAVKAFQKSRGLAVDGIVGPQTWAALNKTYTTLKFGMRGDAVVTLQDALKKQGVFYASSTGYYGKLTEDAVIRYQIAKGLRIDGIAGPETQASLFGAANSQSASKVASTSRANSGQDARADIYWLARIIHAEARGESYKGQVAVGNVVLNRVKSPLFPNSIYGVIFEYTGSVPQFSPVEDGSIYNTPNSSAMKAAEEAYNGSRPVGEATYFFNPKKASGSWIVKNKTYVTTIGNHAFYR